MNAVLTAIRAKQATTTNAAVPTEFAKRMGKETSLTHFDIHADLSILFAGTDPAFEAAVASRLAWMNSITIQNRVKSVARALPEAVRDGMQNINIDSMAELNMELEAAWASETNSHDNGYGGNGPLHTIIAMLNVREAWFKLSDDGSQATNGKPQEELSPETLISTVVKQKINSAYKLNAIDDVMRHSNIIGNAALRLQFSNGLNHMTEAESQRQVMREISAAMTPPVELSDAQLDIVFATEVETQMTVAVTNPDGSISKRRETRKDLTTTEEAVIRYQEAITALCNLDPIVGRALEAYAEDIQDQENTLDMYYKAELALVPTMCAVIEFCKHKMLAPGEIGVDFHLLPSQVQIEACNHAIAALEQAVKRFKSKGYVYRQYKQIVEAACELLSNVTAARYES